LNLLPSFLLFLESAQLCEGSLIPGQKVISKPDEHFQSIQKALKNAHIIDEVVDDFKPKCFVELYYNDKEERVTLGNTLKKKHTKEKPYIMIFCPRVRQTTGLTIVLTDPDAPSRENPKWGEMCHWIAITGGYSLDAGFNIGDSGEDIVPYKSPAPPPKTGFHRYVFLLLEGPNSNLTVPRERMHWGTGKEGHGVRDWAREEKLNVVGANFFYERHKKQ